MCGIAGFVGPQGLPADAASIATRMRDVITHRGPDEAGLYCDTHAALAHRRLSIVDLSSGQQPLANEDGQIRVVFNGEIYNHADIRRELESLGHQYRTKSDTETIVHAYEQWGDDSVDRFRGMFAYALWDSGRRRLLLVRDRLGIKPLYWTRVGSLLVFGSEIKALLASGLMQSRRRTSRRFPSCSAPGTSPAPRRCSPVSTSCCPGIAWCSKKARSGSASTGTSPRAAPTPPLMSELARPLGPQTSSSGSVRCSMSRSVSG